MHVIVVGAGIDGLSTAWSLVKRGCHVTLIEQAEEIPNPLSASGDQHRIIRRAYGGMSGYQRRIDEAYDAWSELWSDLGADHLVSTGFLLISQAEGDEADVYRNGLVANGYPVENLMPTEAADRYPFLAPEGVRFVAYSDDGGVLLCRRIAGGLLNWLQESGADVRTGSRVTAVDGAAGTVDTDDGRTYRGDHIVVTAGAWVLGLCPSLGDRLTTYRTAVAYLAPPEDLRDAWERAPVILDVGGPVDGYVIPPVAGTGLKVGAGIHKRRSGPDADRTPREGEGLQIRDYFAPPFARISEYGVDAVVTCAYTFTSDEHFMLQTDERLTVVSACSGHGYKFGAAVGRRVAAAVVSGNSDETRVWLEARD